MKENATAFALWSEKAKKGTRPRSMGVILGLIFASSELPQVWVSIKQFTYRMKRGRGDKEQIIALERDKEINLFLVL